VSTPHFYLACLDRNTDAVLVYAHKLPNRFTTKAEAHRVAREVLGSERYTVWYATSQGRQRAVATVDARTAAVSL
jgi:hypothetical protein